MIKDDLRILLNPNRARDWGVIDTIDRSRQRLFAAVAIAAHACHFATMVFPGAAGTIFLVWMPPYTPNTCSGLCPSLVVRALKPTGLYARHQC